MDYLTKRPKAVAIPDQNADTIAKIFVELSDHVSNFLIQDVLDIKKIITGMGTATTHDLIVAFECLEGYLTNIFLRVLWGELPLNEHIYIYLCIGLIFF